MTNYNHFDELNRNILNLLESGGFQKSAAIASALGANERTIRRRIDTMKASGVLRVIAIPNPVRLGNKAWAKVGIKVQPGRSFEVVQKLIIHSSIYFVAYALGSFDIIIAVQFENLENLNRFVNLELAAIKGILNTETMVLSYPRKYYMFTWPEPGKFAPENEGEPYLIDETDRKILQVLMQDGLARPASFKKKLGIAESTARKRINNMLSHDVFKLVVLPNPEITGYEVWATLCITIQNCLAHRVIDEIILNPAVYLASLSLGRFNIILGARFSDINLLNKFAQQDLPRIKGIASVEIFVHNKPLKYHNIEWSGLPKQNLADAAV